LSLAELHGESKVGWQPRQEVRECWQVRDSEVRPELDEDRTEFVTEQSGAFQEQIRHVLRIAKPALVGDLLRELQREGEPRWRPLRPAGDGALRRDGVKGGVHLDSIECPR